MSLHNSHRATAHATENVCAPFAETDRCYFARNFSAGLLRDWALKYMSKQSSFGTLGGHRAYINQQLKYDLVAHDQPGGGFCRFGVACDRCRIGCDDWLTRPSHSQLAHARLVGLRRTDREGRRKRDPPPHRYQLHLDSPGLHRAQLRDFRRTPGCAHPPWRATSIPGPT